jgi:hypothetical protein
MNARLQSHKRATLAPAVQCRCQLMHTLHAADNAQGLVSRHDGRQALGLVGAERVNVPQLLMEHLAVQKEQRADTLSAAQRRGCAGRGLGLSGGGHVAFDRQVGEERLHLGAAHVLRVAFGVEQDVARDPIGVGLLGAIGIVPQGDATRCLSRSASRT